MEEILALAFMVFGLGFFLFVIHTILHDNRVQYQNRIMEMREFGLREVTRRRFRRTR